MVTRFLVTTVLVDLLALGLGFVVGRLALSGRDLGLANIALEDDRLGTMARDWRVVLPPVERLVLLADDTVFLVVDRLEVGLPTVVLRTRFVSGFRSYPGGVAFRGRPDTAEYSVYISLYYKIYLL